MIVSASYRSDIPAFYSAWFRARLRAGRCRVANPYGGPVAEVALTPGAVDGFVFWTRNAAPFAGALAEVAALNMPFVVHYTITGYGRALERAVPTSAAAAANARAIARRYGARALVWRYDPIVFAAGMDADWHGANFGRLAAALAGATDEVVVSFVSLYRKTRRNLDRAAAHHGFAWHDPDGATKRALLARLAEIADGHGMRLGLCAQPELAGGGIVAARCIDAERLSDVAGRAIVAREKGNRPGCRCAAARDIGAYDTCAHGCVYCYAVDAEARARAYKRAHDPMAEMLGSR